MQKTAPYGPITATAGRPTKLGTVLCISVQDIRRNPMQPRRVFDQAALSALAASIKQNGILQPLSVRPLGDAYYELVAGERRLRAAMLAGLQAVPCLLVSAPKETCDCLALIENIQREDLDCFEEALAYDRLLKESDMTQYELAKKLGKAQSTLANKLRLLALTQEEVAMCRQNSLTERHARALIRLTDPQKRAPLLQEVCQKGLNVAQTEALVEKTLEQPVKTCKKPKGRRLFLVGDVRIFVNSIHKTIQAMQTAGIQAVCQSRQTDQMLEYTIRIPVACKNSEAEIHSA